MMNQAMGKLAEAQQRTASLLCVGLEPSPAYQPPGMAADLQGYEEAMRLIIEATEGLACAYKVNLAFFEALGWEGLELLYCIRELLPEDVLFIVDGKRGDIGSTARHYAEAIYEKLGADATTINPLMGLDSAEPFLAYSSKLNFFLVLTSNPSAEDFLLPENLYRRIAKRVVSWNHSGNCGFVVGATWPDRVEELRAMAPGVPFLVPGIGAQGGELRALMQHGRTDGPAAPGLLLHVTRGILPQPEDDGSPAEIIRRKATAWRDSIRREQSAQEVS